MKKNYVDNKKLYSEILKFQINRNKRLEEGKEPPQMPDYIGKCIILICENFANSWRFRTYSNAWKEEFIDDAKVDCVKAVYIFNPDQYKNPHAYLTMTALNSFRNRINIEKKQNYIKHKNFIHLELDNTQVESSVSVSLSSTNEYANKVIEDFEESVKKRKEKLEQSKDKPSKIIGLDQFNS